jgi:probable addiction module antidote protein
MARGEKTYEEAVSLYLSTSLEERDYDAFIEALAHLARGHGVGAIASSSGLGRESLYKAFTPGARPRFETVCKVMESLGLRLTVVPALPQKKVGSS